MQTFAATFAKEYTRFPTMKHRQSPAQPHRRFNPLTGDWVLVSPHRTSRPWSGQQESVETSIRPAHDPNCYLCPGNIRAGGKQNPDYQKTFVFTNDFAALLPEAQPGTDDSTKDPLLRREVETGICRVICYSPRHDLSMAQMNLSEGTAIVKTWINEFLELSSRPDIAHVQIFENRGLQMGCSNPHPHGQIWATSSVPDLVAQETQQQRQYQAEHKRCLLCDYVKREEQETERLLFSNDSFTALVPFWAIWPYEVLILPRFHAGDIGNLNETRQRELAEIMIRLSIRYDNLFKTPFPLSMGIHQAPCDGSDQSGFHFHLHFLPPLLRSATVRKHMVGFELLAMPQRDITPEAAAETLRSLRDTHYLQEIGQ